MFSYIFLTVFNDCSVLKGEFQCPSTIVCPDVCIPENPCRVVGRWSPLVQVLGLFGALFIMLSGAQTDDNWCQSENICTIESIFFHFCSQSGVFNPLSACLDFGLIVIICLIHICDACFERQFVNPIRFT